MKVSQWCHFLQLLLQIFHALCIQSRSLKQKEDTLPNRTTGLRTLVQKCLKPGIKSLILGTEKTRTMTICAPGQCAITEESSSLEIIFSLKKKGKKKGKLI